MRPLPPNNAAGPPTNDDLTVPTWYMAKGLPLLTVGDALTVMATNKAYAVTDLKIHSPHPRRVTPTHNTATSNTKNNITATNPFHCPCTHPWIEQPPHITVTNPFRNPRTHPWIEQPPHITAVNPFHTCTPMTPFYNPRNHHRHEYHHVCHRYSLTTPLHTRT